MEKYFLQSLLVDQAGMELQDSSRVCQGGFPEL